MSLSRLLSKADLWTDDDVLSEAYSNPGLPDVVTSLGSAIDYLVASIYPNAQPSVATEADLPTGVDTPNVGDTTPEVNDYRIVENYMGSGQAAGFRFFQNEGQPAAQWNLVQQFDSQDSILQAWEQDAAGLFALLLGNESLAGQTIHGSILANGNLTLSANSGDGSSDPADQTGFIQMFSQVRPTDDDAYNLGTVTERFASLYLSGNLSDGVASLTVAEALAAYNHSQITSGNPHSVAYEELLNRLGNVTVDGDVSTVIVDFSTQGNKTITISITDDSHNHTTSTITDFDDETWNLLKARLVDTSEVSWTFDDLNKEASADVTITTSSVSDIESPAADKILTSNPAGDTWRQSDGNVEINGDITGTGSYSSTTDQVTIASTIINCPITAIDRLDLTNLSISIANDAQATVTQTAHALVTGRKIRVFGTASLDAEYTVNVVDANTYELGVDNSGGIVEAGYQIPDGSQFMYDSFSDTWCVKLEFSQIAHSEVGNLTADDHPQYHNINGRTDGSINSVTGGAQANGNLYLRSTSDATKGDIRFEDNFVPETGASYSGGWTGTDIGSASRRVNNLYIAGVVDRLRVEAVTSLPTATIENKGQIVLLNGNDLYINKDGVSFTSLIDSNNVLVGALNYLGTWNADTNIPDLTSISGQGNKGAYYVVSVDGSTNLDGITDWKATDVAVYNGTAWEKIDNTDAVSSVNGQVGAVVLDKTDVGLTNVTDDAQLKRAGGDFVTYTEKTTPVEDDVVLIEDSEDSDNKKTVKLVNLLGSGVAFEDLQEIPTGTIDGVNQQFSVVSTPISDASLQVYKNGLILRQGVDYSVSSNLFAMAVAPLIGDDLYAVYKTSVE